MPKYGILIHYDFCVGCRVCEIACKKENNRPEGEWGICVQEVKPELTGGKQYFFPFFTGNCNLCGKRIGRGKEPACVHNCWAKVMRFGKIEDLATCSGKKPKSILWVPH